MVRFSGFQELYGSTRCGLLQYYMLVCDVNFSDMCWCNDLAVRRTAPVANHIAMDIIYSLQEQLILLFSMEDEVNTLPAATVCDNNS